MNSTLRTVLCDKYFLWESTGACSIKFLIDGTGELYCGASMCHWIAAIFHWKPLPGSGNLLDQPVQDIDGHEFELDIELTLLKERVPHIGGNSTATHTLHDTFLTEDAFQPKIYKLKYSRGTFIRERKEDYTLKYNVRLLIDPSPYPPLEQWNLKKPTEWHKYWERNDFYTELVDDGTMF